MMAKLPDNAVHHLFLGATPYNSNQRLCLTLTKMRPLSPRISVAWLNRLNLHSCLPSVAVFDVTLRRTWDILQLSR